MKHIDTVPAHTLEAGDIILLDFVHLREYRVVDNVEDVEVETGPAFVHIHFQNYPTLYDIDPFQMVSVYSEDDADDIDDFEDFDAAELDD